MSFRELKYLDHSTFKPKYSFQNLNKLDSLKQNSDSLKKIQSVSEIKNMSKTNYKGFYNNNINENKMFSTISTVKETIHKKNMSDNFNKNVDLMNKNNTNNTDINSKVKKQEEKQDNIREEAKAINNFSSNMTFKVIDKQEHDNKKEQSNSHNHNHYNNHNQDNYESNKRSSIISKPGTVKDVKSLRKFSKFGGIRKKRMLK